jgi:phosphonoacetaldehyde hydrolase
MTTTPARRIPPTAGFQAVVFDWAGTVIDFGSRAPTVAFVDLFRRNGVNVTEAEARGPMGMAKREHLSALLHLPRVAAEWTVVHGHPPNEADLDRLYNEFVPLQEEIIGEFTDVIPGVAEVVDKLRSRGIRIGSTTGYTRSLMRHVLGPAEKAGFKPDCVITAEDVPAGRPAPWLIYRACEQLGVYPLSRVLIVDDTTVGIAAGRNAQVWTLGVVETGNGMGLSEKELNALSPADRESAANRVAMQMLQAGAHWLLPSAAKLLQIVDMVERDWGVFEFEPARVKP